MSGLPDPSASRAVLIGTSTYDHFENIPAVKNNLEGLHQFLTSGDGWGLPPSHCVMVPNPKTSSDIVGAVEKSANEASDTLLVYFAGHGVLDDENRFYLTLQDSVDKQPWTCTAYEWIGKALTRSRTRRRIAIIDSCFSGKVHKRGLMSDVSASAVVKSDVAATGTIVITSARDDRVALAPPGETYTAFTGELLTLLNEGIAGDPSYISIQRAYECVRDSLKAKGRPRPDCTGGDTAASIAIARNRSHMGSGADSLSLPGRGHRQPNYAEALTALAKRIDLKADEGEPPRKDAAPLAGRYRVLGTIGRGGNGWVFRAWDLVLSRVVAVKWIGAPPIATAPISSVVPERAMFSITAAFDQILSEARAVASLNHPGIAAVFDVLDQKPSGYIVMEYVEGSSFDKVAANHQLSPLESIAVVRAVLESLAHAHEAGVIHCDVKPGNVMLTVKGRVKLLDFGGAHFEGQGWDPTLTRTGPLGGTMGYMPPEAFVADAEPNVSRDLYSVGVLFRELITGVSPAKGLDMAKLIYQRVYETMKLPSEITPDVGTEFDEFVATALSMEPALRFQSAIEMKEALERLRVS
ncbi:protein kinase [Streptomyces sp. NPDC051079]|uniref:caspase, EACC1-associated type n=1 Tax=Streptomyces sp. NPDC051079 TaxID=3155043 RepID=UPI00344F48BF